MKKNQLFDLQGVWKNKNMPLYWYNDNLEICIIFHKRNITISTQYNKEEPIIIASGIAKLRYNNDAALIIEPSEFLTNRIELLFKNYNSIKSSCFIVKIEPFGERYFEKM